MFDIVDILFSYWKGIDRRLITSEIFQDKRKYSACDFYFVGHNFSQCWAKSHKLPNQCWAVSHLVNVKAENFTQC